MASLKVLQAVIFIAASTVHASMCFLRQPLSLLRDRSEAGLLLSPSDYNFLENSMMIPLACSQILLSPCTDRWLPRRIIAIALIMSGGPLLQFGRIGNYYTMTFMLMISGVSQGLIWPSLCKVVYSWCLDSKVNMFFGLLSLSEYLGNILANFLGLFLLRKYSWRFLYPPLSAVVVCLSIFAILSLYLPNEMKISIPGKSVRKTTLRKTSWKQIWALPGVSDISLAVCCLKLVKCAMKCWISDFLSQKLGFSEYRTRLALTIYEISNVSGCVGLGFIARKETVLLQCLVLVSIAILGLVIFWVTLSWGYLWSFHLIAIAGFAIGGPNGALTASFPMCLGESQGQKLGAAVVGMITGFGTLGAILERTVVSFVVDIYGWNSMFVLLINLLCFSAFLINRAHFVTNSKLTGSRPFVI